MNNDKPENLVRRLVARASYAHGFAGLAVGGVLWSFERVDSVLFLAYGAANVAAKIGKRLDRGS